MNTPHNPKDSQKQALVDKLNKNRTIYHHKWLISGECESCSATIVSEAKEQPDGTYRIYALCPVITPEEVARFRDYDER